MTVFVLGSQPKKHANTSYKAAKHIKHALIITSFNHLFQIC